MTVYYYFFFLVFDLIRSRKIRCGYFIMLFESVCLQVCLEEVSS